MGRSKQTVNETGITELKVSRLVQKWFRRLMLSDLWTITVKINHAAEDCAEEDHDKEAFVVISDGYDHADMVINAFNVPSGGLELAVAHEMVHLALRELAMLAEASAGKKLSAIVEAATERATERISRALVRT